MHISPWLYMYIVLYIDTKKCIYNHGQCCRDWQILCTHSIYDINIYATATHCNTLAVFRAVILCAYTYVYVCVSRGHVPSKQHLTYISRVLRVLQRVAACCSVLQNDIWHISSMHYAHIVTLPVQSKCPTYIELYISATHTFRHMSALTHVRKPSGLPMLEGYNFSKSQLATQLTVWNQ